MIDLAPIIPTTDTKSGVWGQLDTVLFSDDRAEGNNLYR